MRVMTLGNRPHSGGLFTERCHYPPPPPPPPLVWGVTIDYEYLLSTYFKWMAGVEPAGAEHRLGVTSYTYHPH